MGRPRRSIRSRNASLHRAASEKLNDYILLDIRKNFQNFTNGDTVSSEHRSLYGVGPLVPGRETLGIKFLAPEDDKPHTKGKIQSPFSTANGTRHKATKPTLTSASAGSYTEY